MNETSIEPKFDIISEDWNTVPAGKLQDNIKPVLPVFLENDWNSDPKLTNDQISIDDVREVIELSMKLAKEDWLENMDAMLAAKTQEEKNSAGKSLLESAQNFQKVQRAQRSLSSAHSELVGAMTSVVRGEHAQAEQQAGASGEHLVKTADDLHNFAENAPKSRFFTAIRESSAAYYVAANAGMVKAENKLDEFSEGLKAFANRVRALASRVAAYPSEVGREAKELGVEIKGNFNKSVDEAKAGISVVAAIAVKQASSFLSGLKSLYQKADDKVKDVSTAAANSVSTKASETAEKSVAVGKSAHALISESFAMAKKYVERNATELKDSVKQTASAVSLHADAASRVAGGVLSKAGDGVAKVAEKAGKAVSDEYKKQLVAATNDRAAKADTQTGNTYASMAEVAGKRIDLMARSGFFEPAYVNTQMTVTYQAMKSA